MIYGIFYVYKVWKERAEKWVFEMMKINMIYVFLVDARSTTDVQ